MDAEPGYDTTRLEVLREGLARLNGNARRDGLIVPGGGQGLEMVPRARERATSGSAHRGKAGARRLLTMLRRVEGDGSPSVPGTDFTEAGVIRLLAHLRRRRSQGVRFLRRLHRFLSRPVPLGLRGIAGIGVARLQVVSRQLLEIEAHGWDYVKSVRDARRGRAPAPSIPVVSRRSPDASGPRTRKTSAAKPKARKSR